MFLVGDEITCGNHGINISQQNLIKIMCIPSKQALNSKYIIQLRLIL